MSLTAEEIIKVLDKAKELGIKSIKIEGFEANLSPGIEIGNGYVPELAPEEIIKPLSVLDDLSDEEILYWSTPRYDEIQAEKEAHRQKLMEEAKERNHG